MLSVKHALVLNISKHEKYKMRVIDLVSHRGLTLILIGWSAIQPVCLFDVYLFVPFHLIASPLLSPLLKKYFNGLNLYEAVKSAGLVVQLQLKFLLMKPIQEYIV